MNPTTATPTPSLLDIDGMTCGHCIKAVTEALAAVPGVSVRSVALGRAEIGSPDGATLAAATAALDDAGYPARLLPARESARRNMSHEDTHQVRTDC